MVEDRGASSSVDPAPKLVLIRFARRIPPCDHADNIVHDRASFFPRAFSFTPGLVVATRELDAGRFEGIPDEGFLVFGEGCPAFGPWTIAECSLARCANWKGPI